MENILQLKGTKEEEKDLMRQVKQHGLKKKSSYIRFLLGFGMTKIDREVWHYYYQKAKKQKQKEKKNITS